jgi:hypothetical protein
MLLGKIEKGCKHKGIQSYRGILSIELIINKNLGINEMHVENNS